MENGEIMEKTNNEKENINYFLLAFVNILNLAFKLSIGVLILLLWILTSPFWCVTWVREWIERLSNKANYLTNTETKIMKE